LAALLPLTRLGGLRRLATLSHKETFAQWGCGECSQIFCVRGQHDGCVLGLGAVLEP